MEGQRLGAERSALPVAVQLPTPQLQRCSRVPSTTSGEQRAGIQPEAMPQGFEVARADTRRNDDETEQLRERLRAALEANERLQEQLVERAQADGGLPLSSAACLTPSSCWQQLLGAHAAPLTVCPPKARFRCAHVSKERSCASTPRRERGIAS